MPAWKEPREQGHSQQPGNGDHSEHEEQMHVQLDCATSGEAESASPQYAVACKKASMAHSRETHRMMDLRKRTLRAAAPQPFLNAAFTSTAQNHTSAGLWSCTWQL